MKPVRKLLSTLTQLSYLPRTFRLVWAASRGYSLAWLILLILRGLLPVVIVYETRILVDGLKNTMGTGGSWERIEPVLITAGLIAGIMLLTELLQGAIDWTRVAQSEYVQDYMNTLVHDKSVKLDLAFYESPEFHDRLDRVRSEAGSRSLSLLENAGGLLQNTLTMVSMGAILIPYGAWLPPALLISTLPALFVVLFHDKRYHEWWKSATSDRRRLQYYETMLTHSAVAAELRLFGLAPSFRHAYQELRRRLRGENLRLSRDQNIARLVATLLGLLVAGGSMTWMLWRAFMGSASLGDLALFYQAFSQGQALMRALMGNLGKIYSNSLFLANLFEFLELKPRIVEASQPRPFPSPLVRGITFRDVSFRYPGSERMVLRDFSLDIPSGRITAIVGPNGAGKSTLIKLLCRFHDTVAGSVEMDGINVRDMSTEELWREITVLFQIPVPYHATAAQNIAYGDMSGSCLQADIESAARSAGAHEVITRLPNGYDTLLGRWFLNGAELSSGEWQRIALARAFFRRAQILILDEPTSFMDSWAEGDWFDRFRTLANGHTSIVITHRFTIAMRADIIHVMDKGGIVESGMHHELLARGGLYAKSWLSQMQHCAAGEEPDTDNNAA